MAVRRAANAFSPPRQSFFSIQNDTTCAICRSRQPRTHAFSSSSPRAKPTNQKEKEGFRSRLRRALGETKVEWRPIPVGLGIGFLGVLQVYRNQQRRQSTTAANPKNKEDEEGTEANTIEGSKPKKRKRIRPSGPWQVQVMSTLPLKAMSRLWGRFNELSIPYYLRVPGFKLYSWIFGVNLAEMSETDLHVYPNLASFFYRTLRSGVRPVNQNPLALVSPADGRILQFGTIEHGEVEQVKGMTYSLDALLGSGTTDPEKALSPINGSQKSNETRSTKRLDEWSEDVVRADEEFANVNGISYTLPSLFSGQQLSSGMPSTRAIDASTKPKSASVAEVRADLALGDGSKPWYWFNAEKATTALYYVVVYLAPGDYHRFHSPTAWVAEKRRHFAGELYSVSPYLQKKLPGLFTLNERIVLLGRWRWGFFSFIPVGATNVGSIKINFDSELRTNSLTTDTAADRAAEEAAKRGEAYSGFAEATYAEASKILGGHALRKGEEMGGFQLGSSIVLVFEAPQGRRKTFDEGWEGGFRKGGWQWAIEPGQKVKYGETLGWVDEATGS